MRFSSSSLGLTWTVVKTMVIHSLRGHLNIEVNIRGMVVNHEELRGSPTKQNFIESGTGGFCFRCSHESMLGRNWHYSDSGFQQDVSPLMEGRQIKNRWHWGLFLDKELSSEPFKTLSCDRCADMRSMALWVSRRWYQRPNKVYYFIVGIHACFMHPPCVNGSIGPSMSTTDCRSKP